MRHRKDHRKLSRTHAHRRAVLRNLVTALFEYERIETTVAKAKEARRLAERMITFAKRGDLAARRHVGRFVTRPDVISKLFETVAPWYAERNGGYTRIVRIGRRLGDAGETAYLELVKSTEQREKERQARIAAEEAREKALKGGAAAPKKGKKEAAASAGETKRAPVKPEGEVSAPARRRGRTGVKTGSRPETGRQARAGSHRPRLRAYERCDDATRLPGTTRDPAAGFEPVAGCDSCAGPAAASQRFLASGPGLT